MIIWGLWLDESFWFSTGVKSRKARNLAANPKCVIGSDDAAKTVILEGAVELVNATSAEYGKFAKAYEKKYDWNVREMDSQCTASGPVWDLASLRRSSIRQRRAGFSLDALIDAAERGMHVGNPESEIEKVAHAAIRGMVGAVGTETISP